MLRKFIGFIFVTIGLICVNYSTIATAVTNFFSYQAMVDYTANTGSSADETEVEKALDKAHLYNEQLPKIDKSLFSQGDMLGYLEIPSIDTYLPIRYGTSNEVLEQDLGVVEGSAIPVGGKGTHAVISGHTGMATKPILTELSRLQEDDVFFIHSFGEDLAYKVDQIKVVWPYETKYLEKDDNEDYVTLLTCTPYGINDHRLLVRGHRIDWDFSSKEAMESIKKAPLDTVTMIKQIVFAVSTVVFFAGIVWLIISAVKEHRERKGEMKA